MLALPRRDVLARALVAPRPLIGKAFLTCSLTRHRVMRDLWNVKSFAFITLSSARRAPSPSRRDNNLESDGNLRPFRISAGTVGLLEGPIRVEVKMIHSHTLSGTV